MNIWDVSLDERFTPLKKKSFRGRKHKFLLTEDGQILIAHVNVEKERAHDQIDVYNWKPNVKYYERRAKRVKKVSCKWMIFTERENNIYNFILIFRAPSTSKWPSQLLVVKS